MRHLQIYLLMNRRKSRALSHRSLLRRRGGWAGLGCGALFAVLLVAAALVGALAYAALTAGLPNPDRIPALLDPDTGPLLQPTRLYDRTGQRLLYSLENPGIPRRFLYLDPARPDHFSTKLAQVMVAADDPTFWKHPGVTFSSLLAGRPVTMAEKLADRLLLESETPGLRRSLRARLLALQITARFGRVRVLEWYLNSTSFGHLAYGVESAAQLYLNQSARELTLAQAALLAAVEQAPALNPLDAPPAALENQARLLDRLLQGGTITSADYLAARAETLKFLPPLEPPAREAQGFARLVLQDLAARFGQDRLERGGLRVITTLDDNLQLDLLCLTRAQLARLQSLPVDPNRMDGEFCDAARLLPSLPPGETGYGQDLLASAAVLDVQTGEVLAYAGDMNLAGETGAAVRHSPGSLLSPFVALAGFARGLSPASLVWDIPASLPLELQELPEAAGRYHGPLRMRAAVANDYLAPLAQLLAQVGPGNVWRLAEPLGLLGLDRQDQPLRLLYSGGDVPLLQIGQAYATLARMGEGAGIVSPGADVLQPALLRSVQELDGQVLLDHTQPETRPVLSAPLAYLVHDILADDTARQPTLGYPSPLDLSRPSAAKVGRADGGRQVWSVGYTPERLAVTWLGLPSDSTRELDVRSAAGLWNAAVQHAAAPLPVSGWQMPAGVSQVDVCDPSGLLPSVACPDVVTELFLNGSEPVEVDNLYRKVAVNRETGLLATVFTPPALVEERTYLIPPASALAWASTAGLPRPPEDYDRIQPPPPKPDVKITSPAMFAYLRGNVPVLGSAAGPDFVSYRLQFGPGLNPQTWLQIGSDSAAPVSGGQLAEWDTSSLDGLYALRLQVVRADNQVDSATIQVTVDNQPPVVSIPYPAEGEVLLPNGSEVTLQAQVSDNIAVTEVVWLLDGREIGRQVQPPFSFPWRILPGQHSLTVRAADFAGNTGQSPAVEFEVK